MTGGHVLRARDETGDQSGDQSGDQTGNQIGDQTDDKTDDKTGRLIDGEEPFTDEELAFLAGLFELARSGGTEDLTRAVRGGVPVNLTNSSGDTLLVLAAYHGHSATVQALLDLGADTERVNDRGQTALGAAVFRQAAETVSMLLAAHADPHGGGRSAMDVATFFELPGMLALLEGGGADRVPPSPAD